MSLKINFILLCISFLFTGCSSLSFPHAFPRLTLPSFPLSAPSAEERLATAETLGRRAGFKHKTIDAAAFVLTSYVKIKEPGSPLHVYIEGDGYAWVTRNRVSADPTPRDPLALQLAVKDTAPNVAYLARPCQYTPREKSPKCQTDYWTSKRFSEEVVSSMNQAVTQLLAEANTSELHLVGYSGGGAVAALITAWRQDVKSLRTVGGNLDPNALNEYHKVSPLDVNSLNPINVSEKIRLVPQNHFWGAEDNVVPKQILENYSGKAVPDGCVRLFEVRGADHAKGWSEIWPKLLTYPLPCAPEVKKIVNCSAT